MMRGVKPVNFSIFRPLGCVVCVGLLFSYVLFNVLDIDGSNMIPLQGPAGKILTVPEEAGDAQHVYIPDLAVLGGKALVLVFGRSRAFVRQQRPEIHRFSPLDLARAHGYWADLPRDSIAPLFLPA